MNKKLLVTFSPLLLLILVPFNIPLSVLFYTLEPYGSANPYIILVAVGLTSILLFDYQLKSPFKSLPKDWFFISILGIGSLLLRLLFLDFESEDYKGALSVWFDYIKSNGGFNALKERGFSDYNSVYLYIVAFLTYIPIKSLYSIKIISILFDYVGAYWVYKIVSLKYPEGRKPLYAAGLVLFAPTVFINSSMWAQCDMIYTAFLLMSTYYILIAEKMNTIEVSFFNKTNSYLIVLFTFALGFTFKLQSIFFVLPLVWLYITQKVKLWQFLIIPLVWFVSLVPNWLLGRNFVDLLLIYPRQVFKASEQLTYNAPSIYQFFPDAPFHLMKNGGVFFTAMVILLIAWYLFNKKQKLSSEGVLLLATLSLIIVPFLLPKMHERYFFPADVFTIIIAFYISNRYWLPILMGLISFVSYTPFLFKQETAISFPILSIILGFLIWRVWEDFRKSSV